MSMTDPIGDMLTRIRNAQQRGKEQGGFTGFAAARACAGRAAAGRFYPWFCDHRNGRWPPELEIELKYFDGEPVIRDIRRVSKPGRRVYASVDTIPTVFNGLGRISILSTSKGVMSDNDARQNNVGGEVICTVF